MRIHLLDVGQTKYGDCLLIVHEGRRILIDGAHPKDSSLIRGQLKKLLNQEPPFALDLLVVTHCHSDHIGCLPQLVNAGDLTVKTALVADEKLGWGRDKNGQGPTDGLALNDQQLTLFLASLEEDRSDLPDDELALFLQDAASLESQYKEMLNSLQDRGTKLIRYVRDNDPELRQLEEDFVSVGLTILGPTTDHLLLCAQAIADSSSAATDRILNTIPDNAASNQMIKTYRQLCGQLRADALGAADRPGIGAAKNNQSIVLKFKAGGWSALLAGDMQFAKAEIPGLTGPMKTLRQGIKASGPYDFIKLTHHASYNAVDDSVLDEWLPTSLLAHTGGGNDASHPDPDVLKLLSGRQGRLTFARTDHNGLITVSKAEQVTIQVSRGETNDFDPNVLPDEPQPPAGVKAILAPPKPTTVTPEVESPKSESSDTIEVLLKIPHSTTKVTLTVQVEPEKKKINIPSKDDVKVSVDGAITIAAGRPLPLLVLVTSWSRLARNIGQQEMETIADAIAQIPSFRVVDLPSDVQTVQDAVLVVRPEIKQNTAGILILGGYDVVPANQLDTLDSEIRGELTRKGQIEKDDDQFIVWSDDIYGSNAQGVLACLPVSRIPDGRRADMVFAALQAPEFVAGNRFAVRNVAREFATFIFPQIPGRQAILQSAERFGPKNILKDDALGAVYYMLHGSDQDGTRYWGETRGGDECEAVNVANVPDAAPGSIIFTGCCWGGLTVYPPAAKLDGQTLIRPRGPEGSIALAYLKAGAIGFIGCTGSHYSPQQVPFNYYGAPMHKEFWTRIQAGDSPAKALFTAKQIYASRIPHGPSDLFSRAIEQKILGQYTCLGLGY